MDKYIDRLDAGKILSEYLNFGASTGGGAALVAAAQESSIIKAVVSRGGRPDLAGQSLLLVKSPSCCNHDMVCN